MIFPTQDLNGTQFIHYNVPPKRTLTCIDSIFHASAQWARCHIVECLQSHKSCRGFEKDNSFTPSRLINVDAKELGGDVVLENSLSVFPGSLYVALSYCWGDYKPKCMTTSETLNDNMQRIPWSALPATFQDAINFTRALGIRYLWIDSICIYMS